MTEEVCYYWFFGYNEARKIEGIEKMGIPEKGLFFLFCLIRVL